MAQGSDAVLDIVRSVKGVVAAHRVEAGLLERIRAEEATVKAAGDIDEVNRGFDIALLRECVICLDTTLEFRELTEPSTVLESDSGAVLGLDVPPSWLERYRAFDDIIWMSDTFALFPVDGDCEGQVFVMPPMSFPELNPGNGCRDVVACCPAPSCDAMLRAEYGLATDPDRCTYLVAYNPAEPGTDAPAEDSSIAELRGRIAEAERRVFG